MIPNAICISKGYVRFEGDYAYIKPTSPSNPPNLKKNRAYYLYAEGSNRIYHINDKVGIVGPDMKSGELAVNLGNSFVPKTVPEFRKPMFYLPLSRLGMQQISPGVLVKIEADSGTE